MLIRTQDEEMVVNLNERPYIQKDTLDENKYLIIGVLDGIRISLGEYSEAKAINTFIQINDSFAINYNGIFQMPKKS